MIQTQTLVALRSLAVLSSAVEDYQSFCEAGDPDAEVSAEHIRENIASIREALDKLEASVA